MLKVRRALISVWDKTGVLDLAKKLASLGVEIISTGKTASLLRGEGINAKDVAQITMFPEILSGRVKTLHPKIFGGILANKKHPLHIEEIKNLGIEPIDMVVVNLYPFPEKVKDNLGCDEMIEYIDIGGPSMLRAAAKNFKNVACVSSIGQYRAVSDELIKNKGFISEETLKRLAQDVFSLTREYDGYVYNFFSGNDALDLPMEKIFPLRYGENPHQKAALYKKLGAQAVNFKQLQGKELSYNNFLDMDSAYSCVREFDEAAAAIVKHASLCGVGAAKKLALAYRSAYLTDTVSSFGGIIGLNRKVDKETAYEVMKSEFKECIVAPGFSKEALKMFSEKKNLRVVEADFSAKINHTEVKATAFGYLVQERDSLALNKNNLKVVTRKKPTAEQLKDMVFAFKVVKFVKSNAIVIAKNGAILSIGGGQPSRVGSMDIALRKSLKPLKGAVVASDGFFPQPDSIQLAHKHGIKAIIQPGGSIKDDEVIKACDKYGIAMVFTSSRHFRH